MDLESPVDIDLICRVCMQIDDEMFWIFEELSSEAERNKSVAEMLSECINYKVERYDQLPHLICGKCVNEVRQAYRFKRSCEQNHRALLELLGVQLDIKKEHVKNKATGVEIAIQTEDSALYPCDRCEDKFYTFDALRVHRRNAHNINAIICRFCARTFNRLQSLKTHMQMVHHDQNVDNVLVDEGDCGKGANSSIAISVEDMESIEEPEEVDAEFVCTTREDCAKLTETITTAISIAETIISEEEELEEGEERYINSAGEGFMEVFLDDTEEKISASGDEAEIDKDYKQEHGDDDERTSSASSDDGSKKRKRRNKANSTAEEKRKRGRPRKEKPKQEFPHKCELCSRSFEHEVNLQRHRYHHNEVKSQRTCDNCGKYFATPALLQNHIRKIHQAPSVINCDECPEIFTLLKKYQRHKEKDHGAKFHDCYFCKKSFRSKMYLLRHMEKHSKKQYICRECSQGFTTKEELNEHIKAEKHDKTILCPECGLRCKTSHELTAHRRSHNGEKPYKCKYCSKSFARMDALGMHEKYHIDVKSHFCSTCGKGFHRAYNLRVHERVHTGEKPYQCPHCPQAFKQGNDLKAHIRRHTGERFRCEICNAGFLQCYQMRQHKLNEHGIKEEAPTQRVAKFISPEEQQQQINKQKELTEVKSTDVATESEQQQASDVLISIVWD